MDAPARESASARIEVLFAGVASALFVAAFLALPLAGLLTFPLAAVPIVRVTHRRGLGTGLVAAALAGALLFLVGWTAGSAAEAAGAATFAAALMVLPALFAGAVRSGTDPSHAYTALCAVGFALACVFLFSRPSAIDAAMSREIDRFFDEWLRLSSQPGRPSLDSEKVAQIQTATRAFCKRFWIGLIGASWALGAAINFYVGAWAARPAPSAEETRFERLRVPAAAVPLFVAAGGGWALGSPQVSRVAGNLLWPLAALYFVAGLSIICHFARKWFRARILRIGLYALVVYVPINVGVTLLGLFDWYADFRRRGREIKES